MLAEPSNKSTGKIYIGSSIDLKRRILEEPAVNRLPIYNMGVAEHPFRLMKEESMIINKALLKHSYQNFSLTILEICNKDYDLILAREKHYFEVYQPEYNILKTPGSPFRGSG